MKKERLARLLVLVLALGFGLAALAFRFRSSPGLVEVHAAMPDKGGWLTSNISARVGEPLRLRLVSDDVVHSFALGQSDFEPVNVLPGKPTDVTLTFDKPGTYTFYCTRWCGADHWRMRGTITVMGYERASMDDPAPPLYLQLGIDLDAPREIHDLDLEGQPSAARGVVLGMTLPATYLAPDYYKVRSPHQTWNDLRAESFTDDFSDSQIWDLVAWVWQQNTEPVKLAMGAALYQRDCAACHGVDGAGDGVFALTPSPSPKGRGEQIGRGEQNGGGHSLEAPINFGDVDRMLSASPALLQGKIIRGGMGTGMPSWGLIYTEEQTWALVDHLWTFIFDYAEE